ncbi:MAG: SMP-30/gluconolactonase/LRE family protein [Actinomycetia bacterium]|nr:SMP-30/gluconolactonase/LRE family protein [Actinomycetes bacterium]
MTSSQVDVVIEAGAILGEGPVWTGDSLWWVDIEGQRIHRTDPTTGRDQIIQLDAPIGAVIPRADGGACCRGERKPKGEHSKEPRGRGRAVHHVPEQWFVEEFHSRECQSQNHSSSEQQANRAGSPRYDERAPNHHRNVRDRTANIA